MKIKLNGGKPALEQDCVALETALGCRLSDSYRAFLRSHDGARPENNIFKINDKNSCGVNEFIPVREVWDNRACLENIPPKAYPVAFAECGNFVFLDEDCHGAAFFWDHELPEEIVKLAPSFGAFLDLLEPFDVKSIKLKPGQVKNSWVHPDYVDFLKKFRKK